MKKTTSYIILALAVIGFIGFLALWPFAMINAGHRGVAVEFGKVQEEVLGEGFHVINPFWSVKEYDVRTQKIETQAFAASKDLQSVETVIAVNFHVHPDTVQSLFQETQGDYESTLVAPAIQEAVKAATSQFTADELITKRSEVKEKMREELAEREAMKFFILEDVSIIDFSFSASFNAAIEKKVQAEQDALAAQNKLEQVKFESEQVVVAAEAEAEAIRIQAQSISSQGGAEYVRLKAVEAWDGKLPVQMIPGSTVPFINLQ